MENQTVATPATQPNTVKNGDKGGVLAAKAVIKADQLTRGACNVGVGFWAGFTRTLDQHYSK